MFIIVWKELLSTNSQTHASQHTLKSCATSSIFFNLLITRSTDKCIFSFSFYFIIYNYNFVNTFRDDHKSTVGRHQEFFTFFVDSTISFLWWAIMMLSGTKRIWRHRWRWILITFVSWDGSIASLNENESRTAMVALWHMLIVFWCSYMMYLVMSGCN
jgi:hypothetical protein